MRHWIQQAGGGISLLKEFCFIFCMFLNLLTENSICSVSSPAGDVILLHFAVMLTSVTNSCVV
jgi:hypothetical protein